MMWHFYEIPYIPDLELVKYQSLGEQGIDGILERHNRFLRQWQRNTVLIHTTLHFFLSYTHERPKGSRLQIFLAFSSDQTVNFESIDALMQASPLADYYKIAPIEDVPVCLRKSFTNMRCSFFKSLEEIICKYSSSQKTRTNTSFHRRYAIYSRRLEIQSQVTSL